MADKIVKVKIETDADTSLKSIEDLRAELKVLEYDFNTAQLGTKEFTALGAQVKAARNSLKDLEASFEGLDKEQRATALVDTFNGLTGAVGAVSSAFIAFGASSEAIDDAEKKLLGIIGVVNGLRDVSNGLVAANKLLGPSFDALGTTIKTAMTSGTVATQTFKAALASLGIGALIAGVVLLVDAVTSLNEEAPKIQTAKEKYDEFNASLTVGNSLLQARLGFLKAQFGEEEAINEQLEAATKERAKRNEKDIELRNDLLYAEQDLQIARNNEDKKEIKRFEDRKKEIQANIDANFLASVALESQEKTLQKQLQKIKDDAKAADDKRDEEAAKKAKAISDARIKNTKDALLAEAESKRQLAIQLEDDEKTRRKLVLDDELADLKVAREAALAQDNLTKEAKRAINAKFDDDAKIARDKFNNDIAQIDKDAAEKRDADLKEFQTKANESELKAVNEYYTAKQNEITIQFQNELITQTEYNRQLQQLEIDRLNNVLQATKDTGASTVEVEKQLLAAKLALKKTDEESTKSTEDAKRQAQLYTLQATSQFLGAAAGLAKEGSDTAKAFGLAQIAVDTAIALTNAQAAAFSPTAPQNIATGGLAGVGLYITYAAIILSNVAKARAILKSGGSGGSGGGASASAGGGASIPTSLGTFSPAATPSIPQTGGGLGPLGNPEVTTGKPKSGERVIKTYVLAGDVTSAQQAEAQINQKRKF